MNTASRTVNEVFDRFVSVGGDEYREAVVDLYRSCLDGYGHDLLSPAEQDFWQERYDADEEAASFCNLFGPHRILEGVSRRSWGGT